MDFGLLQDAHIKEKIQKADIFIIFLFILFCIQGHT